MPQLLKLPASTLPQADRLRIVDQATALLEHVYVHRQQKEAQHAVNPRQRLRLLRFRLENTPLSEDAWEFHREMAEIFTSLRDLHTSYLLPAPYNRLLAYLPFLVEPCVEGATERFLVTRLVHAVKATGFERGVELLNWNGIPMRRAIELNGERQAGGNPSARFAQGLNALTMRPLARTLPPDEQWVTVQYRTLRGKIREAKFAWLMRNLDAANAGPAAAAANTGIDVQTALIGQARKHFFASKSRRGANAAYLPTELPAIFRAYRVAGSSYGYLRIFSFDVPSADGLVEECRSLLRRLPTDGLILDVRGNPGGNIMAAEQLLQLFTPRRITPAPMQFVNGAVVLALCEKNQESPYPALTLRPWTASVREAVETGASHSRAFSITAEAAANAVGQEYYGPVVLVTDPLCYSACDMFAAGFEDHGIGDVLGVGGATGAGGANVWHHGLLVDLMRDAASPFAPLPSGAGMTVAIRRSLRTGRNAGSLLEEFGVTPKVRYTMTPQDVLGRNDDLIGFAVRHLDRMSKVRPARRLRVSEVTLENGELTFRLETRRLARVDAWVDNRPLGTWSVRDGTRVVKASSALATPRHLRLLGYEQANAAEAVAAARTRI